MTVTAAIAPAAAGTGTLWTFAERVSPQPGSAQRDSPGMRRIGWVSVVAVLVIRAPWRLVSLPGVRPSNTTVPPELETRNLG